MSDNVLGNLNFEIETDVAESVICPIAKHSLARPEAIALKHQGTVITYKQLENNVRFLVKTFKELDVLPGDRVAIVGDNRPSLVPILFALHRLGASALFLSLQLTPDDWAIQLRMGKARILIGEEKFISSIKEVQPLTISLDKLDYSLTVAPQIDSPKPNELQIHQESSVIFTSSKTGHKKGVLLSIQNFLSSAEASNRITKLKEGDTWAVSLPLYHVGGLGILYRTLLAGATSFFVDNFSANTILPLIDKNLISHISVVPTVLESLMDLAEANKNPESPYALSGLKSGILAGAASSKFLINKIRDNNLPILSAWGMTETTAHCTCMSLDDSLDRITTVGKPFYHTKLGIINDEGDQLEVGSEGEIIVQGPTVCSGYLDPSAAQPIIRSGWLYTGDLGRIDKDGYLSIVGRKDDMFISGGENIHAGEIEEVGLLYPLAKHVAVIPVPHPKWGHRPMMFVQPKDGLNIDDIQMMEFMRSKIAKIKVPDKVVILKEFPRTAIGKVDYKHLKQIYGN